MTIATPQAPLAAKPVASKPAPTTVIPTEIITYAPPASAGETKDGTCWTGSLAVWRDNAWRCSVGNQIYDPCFTLQADKSVVCGANPTAGGTAFTLNLAKPLPTANVPRDPGTHAWLLKLADGSVCGYATGATTAIEGKRLNYLCAGSDPKQPTGILGDPQGGLVWRVRKVVVVVGANGPELKQSSMLDVVTAWH
ncbi:MAG: hypothetical protein ACYC3S_03400 [Chloroflexota bacterium]